MYEFLTGPMMWAASLICVIGLAFQAYKLIKITGKKNREYYPALQKEKDAQTKARCKRIFSYSRFREWSISLRGTIIYNNPFLLLLTTVFHVCLIVTPVFLTAHNDILFDSWGFSLPGLPDKTTHIMTVIFLICAAIFLLRRIAVPEVRAVTTLYDYILLIITAAPFITGYLAYNQLMDYEIIMIIHIISGEVLLAALGVTKLGHMIFFLFSRFLIGSEYSFIGGVRAWRSQR